MSDDAETPSGRDLDLGPFCVDNSHRDAGRHAADHDCQACREWRREHRLVPLRRRREWLLARLVEVDAEIARIAPTADIY